ncbi:uncharacterized protein BJX67DRAFT_297566 [Aspergillus lucknowensis]|uniref:DUF7708 domain-containing protein n=1 Tax=Aspergillus lucknowensis TaxID=176173 RepID=A0ABR4LGB2_9EURO
MSDLLYKPCPSIVTSVLAISSSLHTAVSRSTLLSLSLKERVVLLRALSTRIAPSFHPSETPQLEEVHHLRGYPHVCLKPIDPEPIDWLPLKGSPTPALRLPHPRQGMQSPDTADLDLIAHVDHDASYTLVESVPVLCDCCEEPLTLSMASLATMKQSVPGTLQLPGQALVHQHAGMVEVNRNEAMVTAYQKAISHYRTSLADDDFHKVTQNTTFADVVAELIACKNAQQTGTRKAGKAQQHLDALLQRIHHYTGVIDAATQGNMGMVALVWGSIRFLVQVTSSYLSMQVKLTEMLSEIGDNLGRVELFRNLYPSEHMRCTVTVLYAEIVDALRSMISFWQKRRLDQRIFHAFWNPFEVEYQGTLERIRYLVDHVDRTANASHMAVTKTQNEDILLAVQGMQARLDEHQHVLDTIRTNRPRAQILPTAPQVSRLQYLPARPGRAPPLPPRPSILRQLQLRRQKPRVPTMVDIPGIPRPRPRRRPRKRQDRRLRLHLHTAPHPRRRQRPRHLPQLLRDLELHTPPAPPRPSLGAPRAATGRAPPQHE